jgi:hypothetical protein
VLHVTVPQIPGARVRSRRGQWSVTARGVHTVQRLAVMSVGAEQVREIDVRVESWKPPMPGWLGSPCLPGMSEIEIVPDSRGVRVRIACTAPTDAALLLGAVVRCLRPVPSGEWAQELTFAAGLPMEAAPLAGDLHDVHAPDEKRDRHLRRADVLLVGAGAEVPEVERAVTVVVDRDVWTRNDATFEVCVDPTIHRPLGRRSNAHSAVGSARVSGDVVTVTSPEASVVLDGSVSAANARALRSVDAMVVSGELPARIHRQLNACGVLVSRSVSDLPQVEDALAWQAASVLERRHALRQYGPFAALDAWPAVSVVMTTHRPDHLEHAMRQLAGLRYPRLEVVLGAHGPAVDADRVRELARDMPHPMTVVPLDGSLNLGEALQACTDRAEGALITKMDDDDFYGAEHIWDLVVARQYSGAELVGKALDWIYLESADATVFRPVYPAEKYADFVAGGTILISRADLMACGGWRPVPKSVDRALLDRVLSRGGLVYRTHGLGYVYVRHSAGHTASVADSHFLTRVEARLDGLVGHEAFGTAEVP